MIENEKTDVQVDTEIADDSGGRDNSNRAEQATRDNGRYNRSAIKRHCIKISVETRQGKFSRVSSERFEQVEAHIEAKLREFRKDYLAFNGHGVDIEPGVSFLTGAGKEELIRCFNIWIANEIHRQTKDIRTGKTL